MIIYWGITMKNNNIIPWWNNCIRFIAAFEDTRQIILVTEFLEGGELFEKIVDNDDLIESDCCLYMRQVCQVKNIKY